MAPRSRAAVLAAIAAVGVAEAAVLLLAPRSGVLHPLPVGARSFFSADELARARDFGHGQLWLFLAGLVAQAGALAVFVRVGRTRLAGPWRRPIAAAGIAGAIGAVLVLLAALPFEAIARQREVDVGLATGSWGVWVADVARTLGVVALIAAPTTAAAVALMRRRPRGWWVPATVLVVAAGIAGELLWPLVVAPRFNRFDPLPPGRERTELLALARHAGVRVGGVYVVDASRRTSAVNAYVTGIGSSRRIVLYDTLLSDVPAAQARIVVAHELGHVRYNDVPRGLLYLLLVAPLAMLAIARIAAVWGPRGGLPAGPADVAALLAAAALVALLVTTVSNQLSRRVEARADSFALRLTHQPGAFIAQERELALRNVSDPDPPWLPHVLLGTHPTTLERIGLARAYARSRDLR